MPDIGGSSRAGGPRNNQLNNSLNMQQLRRSRAIAVDRISRTGFPLSFFILNVIYWCVFLNSEDPNGGQQWIIDTHTVPSIIIIIITSLDIR